jgi:carbon storage regulator
MLVLSRKPGERIIIGDNIQVTVLAIRGNQVRLGFSAPGDIPILREELAVNVGGAGQTLGHAAAASPVSAHY